MPVKRYASAMRISVLLSAIFLWMAQAYAQETLSVSGVVTDVVSGSLIGVTVAVKGTATGASTDLDGAFSLNAKPGDVLKFSYIGYKTIEETVSAGRTAYNVVMYEDAETLDEVVVTALGIKREQKSLSYNVQQIKRRRSHRKQGRQLHQRTGLSKVAGVNINASSSGVGGISKVVMRGTKSIMQSSNALYVVDGMPMRSANNGDFTEFGSQGSDRAYSRPQPRRHRVDVGATGAAAAALYGSEAANGAIVITTKKGQAGKTKVTYNSSLQWDRALVTHKPGTATGRASTASSCFTSKYASWGAPLSSYNSYNYQPGNDYFRTGFVSTQSVTISTGNEKNRTYASVAAVNSLGITPNNRYDRYNFNIRNTSSFLNDRMTLDLNAGYVRRTDRNTGQPRRGLSNPLVGALLYPRGNSWDDVTSYERYNAERKLNTQYWPVGDYGMQVQNPYWVNYRNLRENKKNRYTVGASLSYKILDCLTLTGRVRLDDSYNDYTQKYYATTNDEITGGSSRGAYGITKSNEKQVFADFLLSFNKAFGDDWSVQANFGGSISDMRYDDDAVSGPIADGSEKFKDVPVGLANFFAIRNLSTPHLTAMQTGWHEQTQSLYASADVGFKGTYYLTLTGRNDWPSQLIEPQLQEVKLLLSLCGTLRADEQLLPRHQRHHAAHGRYAPASPPWVPRSTATSPTRAMNGIPARSHGAC